MVSHKAHAINRRVDLLLSVARRCGETTLVASGPGETGPGLMPVRPYLNPTGLFRVLGLLSVKQLLDRYIYFPSINIRYALRAERKLRPLIERDFRSGKQVCLITCVPQHDLCLAGLRLKQRFERLQWIVDWQDLWSYDENYLNRIPDIYKKRLLAVEREVFKFADVNVTTNEFAKSILINHYQVPPNKVVAIHHHFSHDDLEPMAQSDKIPGTAVSGKAIKVGYLGNLFKPPKVPGEKVVQAFCRLSDKLGNIELHVFGNMTRRRRNSAKDNSCEAVIFHERTGHKKSLANIARCDFLLLVLGDLPNCRAIMHQKLPHYLMLGKPILAIVPEDSAVARIIHETSSGFVIPTDTEWDLPLVRIFNDYTRNEILFRPNREAIEAYNGNNISKKWQKLFCS